MNRQILEEVFLLPKTAVHLESFIKSFKLFPLETNIGSQATYLMCMRYSNNLSCVLALRIPRTGEPGGLLSMGSHRVRHD